MLFLHDSIAMERESLLSLNAGMTHINEYGIYVSAELFQEKKQETGLGLLVLPVIYQAEHLMMNLHCNTKNHVLYFRTRSKNSLKLPS